jgi:hypothetical protein
MFTLSGLLQFVPTVRAMAAVHSQEPILSHWATLGVGLGLLGISGACFLRSVVRPSNSDDSSRPRARRETGH